MRRSTERPPTSARLASLLFGQEIYAEYRYFQRVLHKPAQIALFSSREKWEEACNLTVGTLPTVATYEAFGSWLRARNIVYTQHENPNPTNLDVATVCGHSLYPGNPLRPPMIKVCPVCHIEQCSSALSGVRSAWQRVGGPWKPDNKGSFYSTINKIWNSERKRLANWADCFEKVAELEEKWDKDERANALASSTYTLQELKDAKSAREALEMMRAMLMEGADVPFVPHPPLNRRTPTSSPNLPPSHILNPSSSQNPTLPPQLPVPVKKTVKFTADTQENEIRTIEAFRRPSDNYQAGRHACPLPDGWQDTSFFTKSGFFYAVEEEGDDDSDSSSSSDSEDFNFRDEMGDVGDD